MNHIKIIMKFNIFSALITTQTVVFFYCIKNTLNKLTGNDLRSNTLLYLLVEKTLQSHFIHPLLITHVVLLYY